MLALFFEGHQSSSMKSSGTTRYVVFSGGDDTFVGTQDKVLDFAKNFDKFRIYLLSSQVTTMQASAFSGGLSHYHVIA